MLALSQSLPKAGAKDYNLGQIDRFAGMAALGGATVLTFPELYLTGYNLGEELRGLAESLDGPAVSTLRRIAQRHAVSLIVGMPERDGNQIFNTAVAIGTDGALLGRYRKIHLFGDEEPKLFTPGEAISIVKINEMVLGLAICYDIELPEMARALVREGATHIAVPTANMHPYIEVPTTVVRARALENEVGIIYANLHGREGNLAYTGLSAIVGSNGRDLVRAGDGEAFLMTDACVRGNNLTNTQTIDLRLNALRPH